MILTNDYDSSNYGELMELSGINDNYQGSEENDGNNTNYFINCNTGEQHTNETSVEGRNNNSENSNINQTQRNTIGRVKNRGKKDAKGNIIKSGKHNEFAIDNTIKKIKSMIIKEILEFVNRKIIEKEGKKYGILKNTLMRMSQKQIVQSKVEYNKSFLDKTIGDILSEKVSRAKQYSEDHNKIIINRLKEKYEDFKILFSITFIECLNYFKGENIVNEQYLFGMKRYSQIKNIVKNKKGQEYADYLSKFLEKYCIIINNQAPRSNRKK